MLRWLTATFFTLAISPKVMTGLSRSLGLACAALVLWLSLGGQPAALAGLTDDNYDGNIFALYAGNGSLVPPKVSLEQSLRYGKAAIVVIYVDDSSDCKKFASVVSQLQAPYGRVANFVPIMADSIPVKDSYQPNEPGYYFKDAVPQTLVFNAQGELVFNEVGMVPYEAIDDVMREVFDLLPRTESEELRRRPINEVNSELVPEQ
ncbi:MULTISPECIES: thylakoid membrane photosystem I accumulation factor [Cyanophyceae]|uniref:thylakoid membrane photosystem I accumulation factor n=1 Tax=Cyanophyceae TaxID=3028117 RepID=UPI0016821623|nr:MULTISPECIES: thylakoid membrane photosystem I accumulation factor [Cyanophyceae]MBD1917803.1 thylakoid membrane photosystem I accumulation factor [Phormidium sp. FACHB-77]MBD2032921.1 thylakoid membrane photosystem I accumulation factor [Phormidium sp. FACHB-322]MBD2051669.1 thylakoid membrane photosystem I accumulation factor [Leptolyngbya sp. FACHB-60]